MQYDQSKNYGIPWNNSDGGYDLEEETPDEKEPEEPDNALEVYL